MRRNFTKGVLAGAIALAGLAGAGQIAGATKLPVQAQETYKATTEKKTIKQKISINNLTGGLEMPTFGAFGMTPKEYGQYLQGQSWYSMSQGKKRSNMNRYAHNAKVGRRRYA